MENNPNIPSEYRVLSPWAYFGYNLLFAIPLVGFICAIIFALDSTNINRRNFARSYFCGLLVAVIFMVLMLIITMVTGTALYSSLQY